MAKQFQEADDYRDSWTDLIKKWYGYLAQSPAMFDRGMGKMQLFEQYVRYVDSLYDKRHFAALFYAVKLDKYRGYMAQWLASAE